MTFLVQSIEQAIQAHRLLRRGQGVLVAVSGGLDSMVLLRVLHMLSARHGWKLRVAHFNHQLRGRSSDADAALTQKVASELKLEFVGGRGDVREAQRRQQVSLEMAARQLRHKFLADTARKLALDTIALAHHADDQLELFFLRLLRGAGAAGLAGMRWSSLSPVETQIRLVRPLLDQPKSALAEFARTEKIRFREDASNLTLDTPRNRIRNELLPLLRRNYQPALTQTTARVVEILGANADFVAAASSAWPANSGSKIFEELHVAVQRSCLQGELIAAGIEPDFELIEQLRRKARSTVSVGPDALAMRDEAGKIHVRPGFKPAKDSGRLTVDVSAARGRVEFGELVVSWRIFAGSGRRPRRISPGGTGREVFDADKIGATVTLRYWRTGDRFQPIGRSRAVKLQDLFTNQKIPRAERHRRIIATSSSGEIFWVQGLRMSEGFKLNSETSRHLEWRWTSCKPGFGFQPTDESAE